MARSICEVRRIHKRLLLLQRNPCPNMPPFLHFPARVFAGERACFGMLFGRVVGMGRMVSRVVCWSESWHCGFETLSLLGCWRVPVLLTCARAPAAQGGCAAPRHAARCGAALPASLQRKRARELRQFVKAHLKMGGRQASHRAAQGIIHATRRVPCHVCVGCKYVFSYKSAYLCS